MIAEEISKLKLKKKKQEKTFYSSESYIQKNCLRPLVFSFELFYIVLSGPFIAHYAVWALLIVEGCTVTYSC